MRRKQIGISSLLILSLLLQLIFVPVNASEASTLQPIYLRIFNGNTEETYTVLCSDNEVYFPAESYEKLTNYTLTSGDGTYGYRLGRKTIVVNVQKREMQIPAQQYTGKLSNIITLDSTDYLPASELLPWMNVACNVHNGVLEIIPDGISMWEVIDDLSYSEYMFNIYEEYGDSTSSIAGLSAMIAFDTIIHLRWDRLIPNDGTISGASKGNSLYDYECYKSALVKIAENDPFSGEKAQQNIKSAIKVNKGLDTLSEVFGFDMDRAQVNIDNFIRESGMGDDIAEQVYAFTETWQFLRDGVRAYGQISKYLDIFTILKTYELTVETDAEYRTYLQWLSEQGTDNIMLDDAISDTIKTLDRNEGVIHAMFLQLGSALVEDLPGEIVEAIVNHSMNDALIDAYNFYTDSIFTSLKTYMGIADFVYSTIIPISSGFEGAAKSGVIETIQDYCWNLASGLQRQEMTAENIAHIRQSYLCALKASKINYEALQDLIDVKAFGKITIFDGEGLFNHKLSAIDEKILQLIASGDATENDSIEGKDDYQRNLRTMFAQLETTNHPAENVTLDELLPLLELLNSFYAETYGAEVNWSESFYRVYENEDAAYNGDAPIAIKPGYPSSWEDSYDPVMLSLYEVSNFSSLSEWKEYLLQHMSPELVEGLTDDVTRSGAFFAYNGTLYLVRGARGYGSQWLNLDTARLIYNKGNKCSVGVDCFIFDFFECTYQVDFVWVQGKWVIENYGRNASTQDEIDAFMTMSHEDIVNEFIRPINEIYGLFMGGWLDAVDMNQVVYRDGSQWGYVKVTDPRFAKYSDFKAYVAQYLSDDIVDELFASDRFIEVGSDTYMECYGGLGSDITLYSLEYFPYACTENSVIFSAHVRRRKPEAMFKNVITENDLIEEWVFYTLEKINGKWVFTDYTPIGQFTSGLVKFSMTVRTDFNSGKNN